MSERYVIGQEEGLFCNPSTLRVFPMKTKELTQWVIEAALSLFLWTVCFRVFVM